MKTCTVCHQPTNDYYLHAKQVVCKECHEHGVRRDTIRAYDEKDITKLRDYKSEQRR